MGLKDASIPENADMFEVSGEEDNDGRKLIGGGFRAPSPQNSDDEPEPMTRRTVGFKAPSPQVLDNVIEPLTSTRGNATPVKGIASAVKGLFTSVPSEKKRQVDPNEPTGTATSPAKANHSDKPKIGTQKHSTNPITSDKTPSRAPERKAEVSRILKCRPTQYYKILSLNAAEFDEMSDDEQLRQMKKTYRTLSGLVHPDAWTRSNGSSEEVENATKAFQLVSGAMEKLGDNIGFSSTAWNDSDGESEVESEEDLEKDSRGHFERAVPDRCIGVWYKANSYVVKLMNDEDDEEARAKLNEYNAKIAKANKKELVPGDKWAIPIDALLEYSRKVAPFLDQLELDSNDEEAREKVLEINKEHKQTALKKSWPDQWIIQPPSKQPSRKSKGKKAVVEKTSPTGGPSARNSRSKAASEATDVNMADVPEEERHVKDKAPNSRSKAASEATDVNMTDVPEEERHVKDKAPNSSTKPFNTARTVTTRLDKRGRLRVEAPPVENSPAQFLKSTVVPGIIEEAQGGKMIQKRIAGWRKCGTGHQILVKYTLKSVEHPCYELIAASRYRGALEAYKRQANAVELKLQPYSFLAALNWEDYGIGGVANARRNPDQDIFVHNAKTIVLFGSADVIFWTSMSACVKRWGEGQMEQGTSNYRYISGQAEPPKKVSRGALITAYRAIHGYPSKLRPRIGRGATKSILAGENDEGPGDWLGTNDEDDDEEDDENSEDVDEYGNILGFVDQDTSAMGEEEEEEVIIRAIEQRRQERQARKAKEAVFKEQKVKVSRR